MLKPLIPRFAAHLRKNWKSHLLNLALLVAIVVAVQAWQTRHVPAGPAPDLAISVLQPDGTTTPTTLAKWRQAHPGQPVALHFWAEWCPICRAEESSVTRLAQDWPVLTVAMQSGPATKVGQVLQQRQLPWQTAVDAQGELTRAFGFQSVPSFVVIDGQGRLRSASAGYTTELGMRLRLWWVRLF
ncbi:MAG: redoxin domain-containing protein [Pseudomonadota bacterium]